MEEIKSLAVGGLITALCVIFALGFLIVAFVSVIQKINERIDKQEKMCDNRQIEKFESDLALKDSIIDTKRYIRELTSLMMFDVSKVKNSRLRKIAKEKKDLGQSNFYNEDTVHCVVEELKDICVKDAYITEYTKREKKNEGTSTKISKQPNNRRNNKKGN